MMANVLKRTVLAVLTALAAPAAAQDATGTWAGVIEPAPGTRLPLVVQIERGDAGALSGTMDSPLQGIQGLPLAGIAVEAGSLAFTVPDIGGSYHGQWDAAAKAWNGEWSQAGMRWPLSFAAPPPPRPLPVDSWSPSPARLMIIRAWYPAAPEPAGSPTVPSDQGRGTGGR